MTAPTPALLDRARAWWRGAPLSPATHVAIGLVMPMAMLVGNMLRARGHTVETAWVSFRYADNFAAGHGLVFNPGERVEGYSNFLWTLLLGVLSSLGVDVTSAAPVLGMLSACAALGVLWLLAQRLQPFGAWPCLATWLTASSFVYGGYAVFGTEAPLLALLCLGAAERFAREVEAEAAGAAGNSRVLPWSGLLMALACMTRIEALVLCVGLLASAGRRATNRTGLVRLGFFLAPVLVHQAWRLAYYGALLPTAALATLGDAKGQLRGGREYLDNYQRHAGAIVWLALSAVAMAAVRLTRGLEHEEAVEPTEADARPGVPYRAPERRPGAAPSLEVWRAAFALALCTWVIVYGVWLLLIGGDGMPYFRLIAPIEPFVFLLVDQVVRTLIARRERVINLALAAFGLWTLVYRTELYGDTHDNLTRNEKQFWEESAGRAAAWLKGAEPGPVAVADIGLVGYRSRLPIVDMLGVTYPAVARLPGGFTNKVGPGFADAVFAKEPRYAVIISGERDCKSASTASSRALFNDPRFAAFRLRESVRLKGGGAWCVYGR